MEYWIKLIGKSSSMGSILVAAIGLAFPPHAAAQLDNALNDLKNLVDNTRKSKDRIESSPNLASTSKSVEQVNVAERFATLVATPKGTDYSHNDWSKISDLFPNVSFKNINDKAYAFSRNAIYRIGGSEYSLSVKGARSMIMRAEMQSVRKCPANAP